MSAPCVLCGSSTELLYDDCTDFEYFMTNPADLYRCAACGLVVLEPTPTREELPGLYPADYHSFSTARNPIAEFLLRCDCPVLVRSVGLLSMLSGRASHALIGDFSLNAANAISAALGRREGCINETFTFVDHAGFAECVR